MDIERCVINERSCFVYTDEAPRCLLIQPTGENEPERLTAELEALKQLTDKPFALAAFSSNDWNAELSPWEAEPAFGNEPFGSGAGDTLRFAEGALLPAIINRLGLPEGFPVIIGGYSLAGLFALWSAYSSEAFTAAAGVSPSVWFPGWREFTESRKPCAKSIYLSLGRKEEKTRNAVMSAVGDSIRKLEELLLSQGKDTVLEWNEGNHFTEPALRTAKGFAWCIEHSV